MDSKSDPPAIRDAYEEQGVREFYEQQGSSYRNPHEEAIADVLRRCVAQWQLDLSRVLDLACGSGEVTLALRLENTQQIVGADPYTSEAYLDRTGQQALAHSFEQIAQGALAAERFSLIVCSYALHLVEPSRLPALLAQLAICSPALLILSPHKRPEIRDAWGWRLIQQTYRHRVRVRLFERTT